MNPATPGTTPPPPAAGAVRPFAAVLQEHRKGVLAAELGDALAEVVRGVTDHGKAGKLTLTLSIRPGDVPGIVVLSDDVKLTVPQGDRGASIFYPDDAGNLSRRDPRQPELPLRDVSADGGANDESEKAATGE